MILLRRSLPLAVLALACAAHAQTHPTAPALSSDPGATYTLYLDFAGFNYPGMWGGGTPGNVPAYDTDGNPASFSSAEQQNIQKAWAAVAQKYSGFNINVTTVDPDLASGASDTDRKAYYDSQAHLMHTIIGGSNAWFGNAGGVSYVGVTQSAFPNPTGQATEYHTNWAFPDNLGGGDPKDVAEAASHENGHGLGLEHQTDPGNPNGYSTNNGASGNGSYAPTLGVGYYSQRSTWRSGTSTDGRGGQVLQNDVQVILQQDSMGGLRDDGIGHSFVTATSLAVTAGGTIDVTAAASKGVIVPSSSTNPNPTGVDSYTKDLFRFATLGGALSLTLHDGDSLLQAGVADPGATFEGTLNILNAAGLVVGTATESGDTLSATYSGSLLAGLYYAQIASIGGVASTYDPNSNYYTMGGYFLTGSGLQAVPEPATLAPLLLGAAALLRRRRRA